MENEENVMVSLRMPKEVYDWIKQLADKTDRSVNGMIVYSCRQMCNEQCAISNVQLREEGLGKRDEGRGIRQLAISN